MEEKTLEDFKNSIEKEIETLKECILHGWWTEENHPSLLRNIENLKHLENTLTYIKQYKRGLI